MPEKYSFRCSEQECSNRVCCTREHVNVTISDLSRWTTQGYLENIIYGLTLVTDDTVSIETMRKPLSKDPQKTVCIFYVEDSNACSIRYSRPISCRTFPLNYNGEKFYVSDKACPGIGKGEVTREALKELRDLAEQEYRERTETASSLPPIYTVVMAHVLRRSAEAMRSLSEEDRKKVEEILSRGKATTNEEPGHASASDERPM
ncbi:MAG: YkgJ family cysteine cluster protein [Candidatus Thorarchaeota archaeon]